MKTNLCRMLGIEYPIIAAPTGPDLVAAVSNAGGRLPALDRCNPGVAETT
jgi:NAD(P)H-dependent flavin oxidoreductase YrpB (nitropropane dioxygenase family)